MPVMVNWAGIACEVGLAATIDGAADRAGVPRNVLRAFCIGESADPATAEVNPNAVGQDGYDIGLLQLRVNGGQGSGHSISSLKDPVLNLSIGVPYIAEAWRATASMPVSFARIKAVAGLSGHPGNPDSFQYASVPWMIADRGTTSIANWWAKLEGMEPTIPGSPATDGATQTANVGPLNADVIGRIGTEISAHPIVAGAAALLLLMMLMGY